MCIEKSSQKENCEKHVPPSSLVSLLMSTGGNWQMRMLFQLGWKSARRIRTQHRNSQRTGGCSKYTNGFQRRHNGEGYMHPTCEPASEPPGPCPETIRIAEDASADRAAGFRSTWRGSVVRVVILVIPPVAWVHLGLNRRSPFRPYSIFCFFVFWFSIFYAHIFPIRADHETAKVRC